jgi:predicted peptidase
LSTFKSKLDIIKHLQIYLILVTLLLSCSQDLEIPSVRGEFVKEVLDVPGYGQLPYNILFPKDYNGRREYPLFLFLHGAEERGNDNTAQLKHVAPIIASAENQKKYPAILVFPQCPANDFWSSVDRESTDFRPMNTDKTTAAGMKAEQLLENIIAEYKIDKDRVYINGISMGAYGTYSILARHPDLVAAGIGVCGGANLDLIKSYQHIPLKIFHGAQDDVIPVQYSRDLANQLDILSAPVIYTEYPELKHDIWNKVYEDPTTLNWLFDQKKP